MNHIPTQRNHYNPCFWTALWNARYFEDWVHGTKSKGKPRAQEVYSLNLRADKVMPTKVERVHFDKNLGTAEITVESMLDFAKRRHPDQYQGLKEYVDIHPESLFMDFEDTLQGVEKTAAYEALMTAARTSNLNSVEHKAYVTIFILFHAMRSHEFMSAMIDTPPDIPNVDKWEYFWMLRNHWSNPRELDRATLPLSRGQWILYRTNQHHFPLCDSPVMVNPDSIMTVLSPRLLLEISLSAVRPEDRWLVRDGISASKYREFRRRAIANTYKELIFHDCKTLNDWRTIPEYRRRVQVLDDPRRSREAIIEGARRVLWLVTGMGRSA